MREAAPMDALFDLGSSDHGSDVAAHKDAYMGEAVEDDARRRTGR